MGVQLSTAAAALRLIGKRSVDILLIDYDEYLPRYRKPLPETTKIVAFQQLPETAASIFRDSVEKTSQVRQLLVSPLFEGRGFAIDKHLAFVLMPFTETWSQGVWMHIKRVCQSVDLRAERADDQLGSEIMEDVWQGICQAKIVIADLTSRNPNVYYELGIAHTLGKPFILLAQDIEDIPFDLRHFRCILYTNDVEGTEKLSENLIRMLQHRM